MNIYLSTQTIYKNSIQNINQNIWIVMDDKTIFVNTVIFIYRTNNKIKLG